MDDLKNHKLDEKSELLWKSMEALAHTLRELGKCPDAGNYGDAITVFCELEAHFGVQKLEPDYQRFFDEVNAVHRAGWIYIGCMSIYIRKAERYFQDVRRTTIEIANVSVARQGQGIFTGYLELLEKWANTVDRLLYIENVIEPRFQVFFERRGYVETPGGFGTKSYFLPTNINNTLWPKQI